MASQRIGLWFIGARGGVASTATLGLLALQRQLASTAGLVSELPQFARLNLAPWDRFVVGGHEIRDGSIIDSLARLQSDSRVLDSTLIDRCRPELEAVDARIRSGSLANCGTTIAGLAAPPMRDSGSELARAAIGRLQRDLREFQAACVAERVVVINLASTEPANDRRVLPDRWETLSRDLENADFQSLPASSLYAIAALELGMAYINFTPSLGSTPAAVQELAELRGTCHAGQDGKTGETLLKSVLAPMFAARNLEVLSWVGHNIFGNLDGLVLDDPANKAAKIKSKDQLLRQILNYDPQTLVSIEYIRSLGDWKTAWDHIHFRGFLGTPMTLQFTWQGCDSLLAAPLVLDLARFVELSHRSGEVGVLGHLGSFFKSPLGLAEQGFSRQFSLLCEWAELRELGG
ncbi:MAG TPA: inositol-3-phosphate synthase [Lacipirellulaceae bacterium]|nr:inositol-3-phosphate synthase [Lacipirellulaceae bacterium]